MMKKNKMDYKQRSIMKHIISSVVLLVFIAITTLIGFASGNLMTFVILFALVLMLSDEIYDIFWCIKHPWVDEEI